MKTYEPYQQNAKLYEEYYSNSQSGGGPMFPRRGQFQSVQSGGRLGGVIGRLQRISIPLEKKNENTKQHTETVQKGDGLKEEKISMIGEGSVNGERQKKESGKVVSGKVFSRVLGNASKNSQSKLRKRKQSGLNSKEKQRSGQRKNKVKRVRTEAFGATVLD